MKKRRAQVALYLIFALVAIFILVLLTIDTFLAVRIKTKLEDRGDAAALAAARRQAWLINEIGRLNIAHIEAALDNDQEKCAQIEAEQRRLALIEPDYALRDADEAARKNGAQPRKEFSDILENHVRVVRSLYSSGSGEMDIYQESYPGAWVDYASAILDVVGGGISAGADNIEFHNAPHNHLLLNKLFYNAIAGEDWCWFLFECEGFLNNYDSYLDWGGVPKKEEMALENSEIFSLHLKAWQGAFTEVFTPKEIAELINRYLDKDKKRVAGFLEGQSLLDSPLQTWFFFDMPYWSQWFDGRRLVEGGSYREFPIVGKIKDQYNVRGCAAIVRVIDEAESFATDSTSTHSWCAAAKPFGSLWDFYGEIGPVTCLKGLVVPCMQDVRLVPVDSVGGENLTTAEWDWVVHVRDHIPRYLEKGPHSIGNCWYCSQLRRWDLRTFRERGKRWLKYHAGECLRPVGGGSYHGGTSHAH